MKYLKTYESIKNYNIRQFVHNLKKYVVYNDNKDKYYILQIVELKKADRDVVFKRKYLLKLDDNTLLPIKEYFGTHYYISHTYSATKDRVVFDSDNIEDCVNYLTEMNNKSIDEKEFNKNIKKYNI